MGGKLSPSLICTQVFPLGQPAIFLNNRYIKLSFTDRVNAS